MAKNKKNKKPVDKKVDIYDKLLKDKTKMDRFYNSIRHAYLSYPFYNTYEDLFLLNSFINNQIGGNFF